MNLRELAIDHPVPSIAGIDLLEAPLFSALDTQGIEVIVVKLMGVKYLNCD